MATKAQIQALIESYLTGNAGVTTWEQHEDMLKDNTASILENSYGTVFTDTQETTQVFTAVNASREYNVKVIKQGRNVHVSGNLKNETGITLSNTNWFQITNSEYFASIKKTFYGTSVVDNSQIRLDVNWDGANTYIRALDPIVNEERVYFELIYQTDN